MPHAHQHTVYTPHLPLSIKSAFSLYCKLLKSKVVMVMVFSSCCGMLMVPSSYLHLPTACFGLIGITLLAAGAAALNQLFEMHIDKTMQRTSARPLAQNHLSPNHVALLASFLTLLGTFLLQSTTNLIATITTLATFIGYAVIYTRWLKPSTPQNIVIGGLSGAMPPLLGWLCLKPSFDFQPLLMVLIIFLWTPAHFWPLAIWHRKDYARSGLPMLPNTHGIAFTQHAIMAYSKLTFLASLLPVCLGMSNLLYLGTCVIINIIWLRLNYTCFSDLNNCMRAFRFSILYLISLFASMLLDHHLLPSSF